jgi:outer membrane protein OmpA-like peptidoglycan-associated protein
MNKIVILLAGLGVSVFLAGCATRSTVVLIPDPDGNVGQVVVTNERGQQVLNGANQSVTVAGRNAVPGAVTTMTTDEIQAVFSDALAARPLPPARFILYFLLDSDVLTRESKAIVPEVLATIRKRSSVDVVISGHTDTVGTKEYNYKLGLTGRRRSTTFWWRKAWPSPASLPPRTVKAILSSRRATTFRNRGTGGSR